MPAENTSSAYQRDTERWIARLRLAAIPFAIVQVLIAADYPRGYERAAWIVTGVLAAGSVAIAWLAWRPLTMRGQWALSIGALVFDTAIVSAFTIVYSFETGSPVRQLLYLAIVEGAVRFGLAGPVAVIVATVPVVVVFEHLRGEHGSPRGLHVNYITFQIGAELIVGAIVGWLVRRLNRVTTSAESRAAEAEGLRDELGRRADTLEAVNRCARALGSSLDLETAFSAFIRELRGLVPFDRTTIMLLEDDSVRTIAVAGRGRADVFPAGSALPLHNALTQEILAGQTVVRNRMDDGGPRYEQERELVGLGLRSRVAVPLVVGTRAIGMLSLSRVERDAFDPQEVELITLLGRLAGNAVQNIRAYESERHTAEELRRLSALRADFVSLVSHELRSPMAAVIGASRTLQHRWRQLAPEQRDAFLALIGDETDRLTTLIGDVLDTSRIEAGTFSFSFDDVEIDRLVDEAVSTATLAQDEVPVVAKIASGLPRIRGDRVRLRQVVLNLIDNAVKYSPVGQPVEVAAAGDNGVVRVEVRDRGPGIASDQQELIFEKFGRGSVVGGGSKPGTGLGLFIARSIAEAHGGTLRVYSRPGEGATFTLTLPTS